MSLKFLITVIFAWTVCILFHTAICGLGLGLATEYWWSWSWSRTLRSWSWSWSWHCWSWSWSWSRTLRSWSWSWSWHWWSWSWHCWSWSWSWSRTLRSWHCRSWLQVCNPGASTGRGLRISLERLQNRKSAKKSHIGRLSLGIKRAGNILGVEKGV